MITLKSKGFFVCDYFTVDQANKPSVIGMFRNVNLQTLPSKFLKFVLVIFLESSVQKPDDGTRQINLRLTIDDPDGQKVNFAVPDLKINIDPAKPDGVISIDIGNFEFSKYGDYMFKVERENKILDSAKINVKRG